MTPSAMSLPVWTQSSSRVASWPGPKPSPRRLLPGEVVAIDGKTARRSYDWAGSKRAMHLVSAWATRNTLTLGQVRTEEKSNEITAIPQLLNLLDLQGCIVTIDAMGCQREIAQQIVDGGPRRLPAGGEGESGSTPRGHPRPVRRGRGIGL